MQGGGGGVGMVGRIGLGRNSRLSRLRNGGLEPRKSLNVTLVSSTFTLVASSSSGSKRRAYWLVVVFGLSGVISLLLMSDGVLDIWWVKIQKLELLRRSISHYNNNY